jgi:hypothetical protein
MYYDPVGIDKVGAPVFVRNGDAISPSRLQLWMFVRGGHHGAAE